MYRGHLDQLNCPGATISGLKPDLTSGFITNLPNIGYFIHIENMETAPQLGSNKMVKLG